MSVTAVEPGTGRTATAPPGQARVRGEFPPRGTEASWQATRQRAEDVLGRLTSPPFVLDRAASQSKRLTGLRLLLQWLGDQPGSTWQERWLSSGADPAGRAWRDVPAAWLHEHGHLGPWRHAALVEALPVAVSADLVRPSVSWLVSGGPARGGLLVRNLETARDPEGFARLRARCEADRAVSVVAGTQVVYRSALVLAAKGGTLAQVTVGDVVELAEAEAASHASPSPGGRATFYRILHELGSSENTRPRPCACCAPAGNAHRRS